jgi:hypothetical protein
MRSTLAAASGLAVSEMCSSKKVAVCGMPSSVTTKSSPAESLHGLAMVVEDDDIDIDRTSLRLEGGGGRLPFIGNSLSMEWERAGKKSE